MSQTLAVVGTDTGVGKTVVAAGLILGAQRRGRGVAAFKAVETGLDPADPQQTVSGEPADWARLSALTGQGRAALGVAYELPAAPLAAALSSSRPVPVAALEQRLSRLQQENDLVVLEGAGGFLVPVQPEVLWADLVQRWATRVVLVGRLGLGTINHTLLTLESLRRRKIDCAFVQLSATEPTGPEAPQTIDMISQFCKYPLLEPLPYDLTKPSDVATHLERSGALDLVLAG